MLEDVAGPAVGIRRTVPPDGIETILVELRLRLRLKDLELLYIRQHAAAMPATTSLQA